MPMLTTEHLTSKHLVLEGSSAGADKPGMTKVAVVVGLRAKSGLEGEQWKSLEGSNLGLGEGWPCGEEDALRQRLCYLSHDPTGVKQQAGEGW